MKTPSYLNDYICGSIQTSCPYFLNQYLSYNNLPSFVAAFASSITVVSEPHTFAQASKYVEWQKAMKEELDALMKNNTWSLVHLPHGKSTI